MLDVLLESQSHPPRPIGGTLASAVFHALLISAAVAVAHPMRDIPGDPPHHDAIVYVPSPHPDPTNAGPRAARGRAVGSRDQAVPLPTLRRLNFGSFDVHPPAVDDDHRTFCTGCTESRLPGTDSLLRTAVSSAAASGVFDPQTVDRVPRVLGRAIEPRYPATLRDAGVQGIVAVQFVVDTLGRVDPGSVQVVESPHLSLTEAVRDALARYRFAPGEVAGRRVATRVQLPFEFKLR